MAEKNTLSILESIKQKMVKFDQKQPKSVSSFKGDEFDYKEPPVNVHEEQEDDAPLDQEQEDDVQNSQESAINFTEEDEDGVELDEIMAKNQGNDDFLFDHEDKTAESKEPLLHHDDEEEEADEGALEDEVFDEQEEENVDEEMETEEDYDEEMETGEEVYEEDNFDDESLLEDEEDLEINEDEQDQDVDEEDEELDIDEEGEELDIDEDDDALENEAAPEMEEEEEDEFDIFQEDRGQGAEMHDEELEIDNSVEQDEESFENTPQEEAEEEAFEEEIEELDDEMELEEIESSPFDNDDPDNALMNDIDLDSDDMFEEGENEEIKAVSDTVVNEEEMKDDFWDVEDDASNKDDEPENEDFLDKDPLDLMAQDTPLETSMSNRADESHLSSMLNRQNKSSHSLISEQTIETTTQSIQKLIDANKMMREMKEFSQKDAAAFNELAIQLMEPKLEKWLNENLPHLVESIIREELKKVIPNNKSDQ